MQATTILAIVAIVIVVGFIAANSIIPQASASKICVANGGACSVAPGHDIFSPPGQEEHLSAVGPGSASQYAPGHLK